MYMYIQTVKRLKSFKIKKNKKRTKRLAVSNKVLIFAVVKQQQDNEKSISKYILVALFTTPTVVREQRSCIYTN